MLLKDDNVLCWSTERGQQPVQLLEISQSLVFDFFPEAAQVLNDCFPDFITVFFHQVIDGRGLPSD